MAFAEKPALDDTEQLRRRVANLVHRLFQGQHALVHQFDHHGQRVLHQGQAGRCLEVGRIRLLRQGVGRVIGRDHVQQVLDQGKAQGIAIAAGLDRRVALDQAALGFVIGFIEIQVVDAGLGGDALALQRTGGKQLQLTGAGQVQDVEARVVPPRQLDRQRGGLVAGVDTTDLRMKTHRDGITVLGAKPFLVGLDGRGVFAMRRDQGRRIAEQLVQGLGIVHQHVAGGCAHEHLDPAGLVRVEASDLVDVVVGRAEIEGVVSPTAVAGERELGLQRVQGHGLRVGVGHFHPAGDTPRQRRARLRGHVALVGHAGFAKMHLVVDDARHQHPTRCLDDRISRVRNLAADPRDAVADDQQVAIRDATLVHQAGILDQCLVHFGSP